MHHGATRQFIGDRRLVKKKPRKEANNASGNGD